MKALILTTNTPHHNFYIRKLIDEVDGLSVIYEQKSVTAPYEVKHEFEDERDKHERDLWGKSSMPLSLSDVDSLAYFSSINHTDVLKYLANLQADVCVVFGTRKINRDVLNLLPDRKFNLHGGDPNWYRGLDSHLWALWHNDALGLATTLHELNDELDDGRIFKIRQLDVKKISALYQLRAQNTQICVDLTLELFETLKQKNVIQLSEQTQIGRNYSFMPSVLKEIVVRKFD